MNLNTFGIIELIVLGLLFIAMGMIIYQECNRRRWKEPYDIPSKQEKYLFKLESGVIIYGYATTVTSEYYRNNPQWVFDQEKSGIHFNDSCGYRIFKWMEVYDNE